MVAKGALVTAHPLAVTAGSYLVAGLVLSPFLRGFRPDREDLPRLAGMVLAGSILAPACLFYGLRATTAVTASLLQNLEMVFTGILAYLLLGERLRGREALGLGTVAAGAVLVSTAPLLAPTEDAGSTAAVWGAVLVMAASLGWAIDNAVSTPLARKHDVRHLLAVKGLLGSLGTVTLLLVVGASPLVPPGDLWRIAFVGLFGIAVSTVLFYLALRHVGAVRTSVLFSTAGLFGAAAARVFLDEPILWPHVAGALVSTAGVGIAIHAQSARSAPGQRIA